MNGFGPLKKYNDIIQVLQSLQITHLNQSFFLVLYTSTNKVMYH